MDEGIPAPRRMRFSILSLILLTTFVAMALIIFRQNGQMVRLRQTVSDAGYLDVRDKSQFHAIYVPTYDELTWRWRVWLPEGHSYELAALCNRVPPDGYPDPGDDREVVYHGRLLYTGEGSNRFEGHAPGEYVITVAIRKNESTGEPEIQFHVVGGVWSCPRVPLPLNDGKPYWEEKASGNFSVMDGLDSHHQRLEDGDKLLLMRLRRYKASEGVPVKETSEKDGLMFWIQPIKP